MFDNLIVKKALPLTKELKSLDVKWDEEVFQTKDLDNLLDTYEITKSGKLRHLWQERVWKDDDNAFLKGYLDVVKEEWRDVNFHGTINFYTSHTDNNDYHWDFIKDDPEQMAWEEIDKIEGSDWWIEFEAYFTKGKLDEIKLIKATKEPIKDRIKNNKEWAEKRAIENRKSYKRVVNYMKKFDWYRKSVRWALNTAHKVHTNVTWVLYRM